MLGSDNTKDKTTLEEGDGVYGCKYQMEWPRKPSLRR